MTVSPDAGGEFRCWWSAGGGNDYHSRRAAGSMTPPATIATTPTTTVETVVVFVPDKDQESDCDHAGTGGDGKSLTRATATSAYHVGWSWGRETVWGAFVPCGGLGSVSKLGAEVAR